MGISVDDELLTLFRAIAVQGDDTAERALLVRGERHGTGFAANIVLKHAGTFSTDGGSAQDEFRPAMNALLLDSPDGGRSVAANVLYRLDSRGAAGLWEWICVLYQPDDAPIKDKMQFGNTRTALLQAIGERDLLDVQTPGSFSDVSFPTKLRNARKIDYQNPQLSTAGKPAAQAAGTGTGGARRNFHPVVPGAAARTTTGTSGLSPKPSLSSSSAPSQPSPSKPATALVNEPETFEHETTQPAEPAQAPSPAPVEAPGPEPVKDEPAQAAAPEPVEDEPAKPLSPESAKAPSLEPALAAREPAESSEPVTVDIPGEVEPEASPAAEVPGVEPVAKEIDLNIVDQELEALTVDEAQPSAAPPVAPPAAPPAAEVEEASPVEKSAEVPAEVAPAAPVEAHVEAPVEAPVETPAAEETSTKEALVAEASVEKNAPSATARDVVDIVEPEPEPAPQTTPAPPVFGAPRPASPKKSVQEEAEEEPAVSPAAKLQPPPVFGAPKPASPRKPIDDPFGPGQKSDIAVGMGQGEAQEEEEEAVRRAEAQERADQTAQAAASSAPGIAALGVGVSVDPEADEAVRALPHSTENTVIMSLHGEALGLASAPLVSTPEELQSHLTVPEPRLAFYRFAPEIFLYIYSCPSGTPVRQRMLYSVSVMPLLAAAKAQLGLVKKVEVTDIEDLTPDVLEEAAASLRPPKQEEAPVVQDEGDVIDSIDTIDTPVGGAATLATPVSARPKRPGRH